MPRYICKLNEKYFEWSTVVDDAVTDFLSLRQFEAYYFSEYLVKPEADRMKRVEAKGTSSRIHKSILELIGKRKLNHLIQLINGKP